MFRKNTIISSLLLSSLSFSVFAEDRILIKGVNIFDGTTNGLASDMDVLIEGNTIKTISKGIAAQESDTIVEGDGRTLTPGFIDAHVHLSLQLGFSEMMVADEYRFAIGQVEESEAMLLRGFTTARDMGGNTFSLKKAIDQEIIQGPRIYPSGGVLTQTGGHADYRMPNSLPKLHTTDPDPFVRGGHTEIVDGQPQVLTGAREQLRKGASQVKLLVGGGAASPTDPLDVTQFLPEEVEVAVKAAQNWNTYVAAHVYNNHGIRMALDAGVQSIEHANFINEENMDLLIEKDAWLSVQTLVYINTPAGVNDAQKAKFAQAFEGLDNTFSLIKKKGYKKVAFGTDVIGDHALMSRQNEEFTNRSKWFSNYEILRQATSGNAELLAMSGPRNPYPGKLGVVKEGALADLILIDGNPLEDLSVLSNPSANFHLIMKNGNIYKNTTIN
ncbi:metal-dependent hydrolase family protein [Vibrio superstes]|uniref:Hydrolase n=1 Tax=Vibrio superstes NBRC 103154 TaxID=1219062 RepID=A0A511QQ92_9VIBR|nr:amidohydrolase family protein [Vibrio superstes]GEM79515.1 hydrolase [Vibrio superstes NBRC 103154]